MIVQAAPPEHYAWLAQHGGAFLVPDFCALEAVEEGRVLGMVGYCEWAPNSVRLHVGIEGSVVVKHLLGPAFAYPFEEVGVDLVIGITPAFTKAVKFCKHLGFRETHRIKNGWCEGVDFIVFEMRREECRWLGSRWRLHQPTYPTVPDWEGRRAMTLSERVQSLRGGRADEQRAKLATEHGKRRLGKWKSQPPFDFGPLFEQRLGQAGLTESEFLELLSLRTGASGVPPVPPPWALEIASAFARPADERPNIYPEHAAELPELRFLELVRPLITQALEELRQKMKALAGAQPRLSFELNVIEAAFLGVLAWRLLAILERTMVLELNVARLQGLLAGRTSEERFASFINRLQQPQVRLAFFTEYPVLGRLVVTLLENWRNCSLEFLQRWSADWPAICATFSPTEDPGPLLRIEGGVGDCHRGGRAVWILE